MNKKGKIPPLAFAIAVFIFGIILIAILLAVSVTFRSGFADLTGMVSAIFN